MVAVAIPFSVSRRRLPKIPLILGALAFLLVVIPFTGAYRSVVRQGSVTLTSGPGGFRRARDIAAGHD